MTGLASLVRLSARSVRRLCACPASAYHVGMPEDDDLTKLREAHLSEGKSMTFLPTNIKTDLPVGGMPTVAAQAAVRPAEAQQPAASPPEPAPADSGVGSTSPDG